MDSFAATELCQQVYKEGFTTNIEVGSWLAKELTPGVIPKSMP